MASLKNAVVRLRNLQQQQNNNKTNKKQHPFYFGTFIMRKVNKFNFQITREAPTRSVRAGVSNMRPGGQNRPAKGSNPAPLDDFAKCEKSGHRVLDLP